jgi:DNA-binding transcriptional regulator GbsR (MarR family)
MKFFTAHHSRIPEHSSINKILQKGERQRLFPRNKKFSSILFYRQMKKLSAGISIGKQILETCQCDCGDDSTKHF